MGSEPATPVLVSIDATAAEMIASAIATRVLQVAPTHDATALAAVSADVGTVAISLASITQGILESGHMFGVGVLVLLLCLVGVS